jgi:hypothetical protein
MRRLEMVGGLLRKTGPYLALELLLPGGTLFALALFVYQRRREPRFARPFNRMRRWMQGTVAMFMPSAPARASVRMLGRTRATV